MTVINVSTEDTLLASAWCISHMGARGIGWNYLGAGDFAIHDDEMAVLFILRWGVNQS